MDIKFENADKTVFNYRTAAVIINDNKILLHKMGNDDYWTLIGGRVEMLESSDYTIKREVKEELGEEVEINKTLWIVENFFEYEKKSYHEISTIYLVRLPKGSDIINKNKSFYGPEGNRLSFKWFNIKEVNTLDIRPSFLVGKLNPLSGVLEHIIHRDILHFVK